MAGTRNLGDLIDTTRDLDKVALIDLRRPEAPEEISYRRLHETADAVARGLAGRGLGRGERVAILAANRWEFLAAYLGIMRAGLVATPLNWKFPPETLAYVAADAAVRFVFADAERRAQAPAGVPLASFDDDSFTASLDFGPFDTVEPTPDEIGQLLYTSGSTGRPKGVPLSHHGQRWVIDTQSFLRGAGDFSAHRMILAAPLFHMNALMSAKVILAGHASSVILPQFRAGPWIEAVARWRVTSLTAVPTMLALVVREPELWRHLDLGNVQTVGLGSAPLTQALVDKVRRLFPNAVVTNGYGTTEAGAAVFGPHPDGRPRPDLSVGYPVPGIGLRLVGGETPDEGVLQMKTPALMPGYLNLPHKTAERMTADGYYDSGDIFRCDGDGFYFFVGRADDMFVTGGENIYPGEVETMLERHPGIHQAAVVPVSDEIRGAKPVAFVVARPGASLTEDEVRQFALAHAPAYQHPRHVVFVEQLPLAGTNKIDRTQLIREASARFGDAAA